MNPTGTEGTQAQTLASPQVPTPNYVGGGIGAAMIALALGVALISPRRAAAALPGPVAADRDPSPLEPDPPTAEAATLPGAMPRSTGPDDRPLERPVSPAPVEQEAAAPVALPPAEAEPAQGIVARLREALHRSRAALRDRFDTVFGKPVDEALFEELEETLLLADVGLETSTRITDSLRELASKGEDDPAVLRTALRKQMTDLLEAVHQPFCAVGDHSPLVVLVVGVNGSGKTTTIGKLASRFSERGHSVLLAAADTYRAAAGEQLKIWAERSGSDFIGHEEGSDPGAVVYDALEAAKARGKDVVLIDTAGRLQTRKPLMEQLAKLRRVVQKHVPDGPHETLLVLDGTMGQNGLSQARLFNEATPLSGVVVTKLDGTAKGGMVLTIAAELALPVKFIGIGEGVHDLRDFEPAAFVEALA